MAAKIIDTDEGLVCAELIREFLEFYKMNYTLQIFGPECNLPAESRLKGKLAAQLGLDPGKANAPVLAQLVMQQLRGGKPNLNIMASPLSPASDILAPASAEPKKSPAPQPAIAKPAAIATISPAMPAAKQPFGIDTKPVVKEEKKTPKDEGFNIDDDLLALAQDDSYKKKETKKKPEEKPSKDPFADLLAERPKEPAKIPPAKESHKDLPPISTRSISSRDRALRS